MGGFVDSLIWHVSENSSRQLPLGPPGPRRARPSVQRLQQFSDAKESGAQAPLAGENLTSCDFLWNQHTLGRRAEGETGVHSDIADHLIRSRIRRHMLTDRNFCHFGHLTNRQDFGVKIGSCRKKWENFFSCVVEGTHSPLRSLCTEGGGAEGGERGGLPSRPQNRHLFLGEIVCLLVVSIYYFVVSFCSNYHPLQKKKEGNPST